MKRSWKGGGGSEREKGVEDKPWEIG